MENGELSVEISESGGEIYLTVDVIGDAMKIVVTEDCITAVGMWFLKNGKKRLSANETNDGTNPTLFFTEDIKKRDRIWKILQEN